MKQLSHIFRRAISLLVPYSYQEFILVATDFLRVATLGLRRLQESDGLYEVLSYEARLELLDDQGKNAIYTKHERVRFLKDCPTGFYDYGWGDGQTYSSHRVHPGKVLDRQPVGPRYRSLIALPAPLRRGDTFSFTVRRRLEDGFLTKRQWWMEVEVYHRTKRLTLTVVFPTIRPTRNAWVISQRRLGNKALRVDRHLPDGRQKVFDTVHDPEIGERYTLRWDW